MLSWLKGKVTGDSGTPEESPYDSFTKITDAKDSNVTGSASKNTLVVVRDGATPKLTLDSNDMQVLKDIPEFKPLLTDTADPHLLNCINVKSLLTIFKKYQDYLQSNADLVSQKQNYLTSRMKEVDMTVKVIMDRLAERQKDYARCADQLKKTHEITQTLKKLRYNLVETGEMLNQLNSQLPPSRQLPPFSLASSTSQSGVSK